MSLTGRFLLTIKAGQLSSGPKGDKGDKGSKGDKGDVGVSDYEIVDRTITVSAFAGKNSILAYVDCPADNRALGGRATTDLFDGTASGRVRFYPGTSTPCRLEGPRARGSAQSEPVDARRKSGLREGLSTASARHCGGIGDHA